jgi:phosphate transport system protein
MGHDDRAARHFLEELTTLKEQLLAMGGLAEERVRLAVRGLIDRDSRLLADVVAGDAPVNQFQLDIDDRCFKLLALHQPMAVDLRFIVAASRITVDLERVGDLAVNIAEAAERYLRHPPVKPLVDIPRMADLAQAMLRDALDGFVTHDVRLAKRVLERDDTLDMLKDQVFREVLAYMLAAPQVIEPSLDLVLISRHLERVGDHATNIAEDVIFIAAARDVRHRAVER